ncbi:MAG: hypothetical protein JW929_00445 [Anaerolineales bacterium]|nr:hypothetical protein [Anaerolineales bacterium]
MFGEQFAAVGFCLSPFVVLGFIVAVIFRILRHKEIIQSVNKGIALAEEKSGDHDSPALSWGIVIASVGLALILGLLPLGMINWEYPLGLGPWMLLGYIPFLLGLGLVIVHAVSRPRKSTMKD